VSETGIYVYAVSRGLPHDAVARALGVDGAAVRVLEECGLAAVVSTVNLADFGEEALQRNLEDLGWLESTARAHHGVIDSVAASAVTLPLRLVTVYRTDQRVRDVLRERNEEFTQALDRITGRTEWGVKGYADPQEFSSSGATGDDPAGARPGTSYLLRRRAERHTEEEARQEAAACAQRIDTELCDIAATRHLHPPQDPQLSGHQGWMILNGAYLVDDKRAEDFRTAVAGLTALRPGIRLQLTGPWAPYSFATEEESWTGC
jgi:hypothetical protein